MDHLRKVQSGQKLEVPVATFNSFIDAARDFKDRQRDKQSKPEPYFPDSGIILVANNSGQDRNRFDVLGVTEPIIRPEANLIEFKRRPTFRGVKPTAAHKCRFVILLEPVKANKIAHAVIAGVTVARIRVDDPFDTCCDIQPRVCDYLQTSIDGSAQILWKQKTSGVYWAIIRFGNCCEMDESSSSSSWSDSSSPSEDESSSVSESPSESESDECCGCRGVTATVRVLVPKPYRSGDDLCFPMADLQFVDGCYQGMSPAGVSCHYICCDESSDSGSDDSSSDESSDAPSGSSQSPDDSSSTSESDSASGSESPSEPSGSSSPSASDSPVDDSSGSSSQESSGWSDDPSDSLPPVDDSSSSSSQQSSDWSDDPSDSWSPIDDSSVSPDASPWRDDSSSSSSGGSL